VLYPSYKIGISALQKEAAIKKAPFGGLLTERGFDNLVKQRLFTALRLSVILRVPGYKNLPSPTAWNLPLNNCSVCSKLLFLRNYVLKNFSYFFTSHVLFRFMRISIDRIKTKVKKNFRFASKKYRYFYGL
jgi:hypothetical protein